MYPTNAESMRTFDDTQVLRFSKGLCYEDLTEEVFEAFDNMKLTHPDSPRAEDRATYWKEVRELIALYYLRVNGVKSKEIFDQIALVSPTPVTYVFNPEDTIEDSAGHVFGDLPTTHVTDFILGQESNSETAELLGDTGYELLNFKFMNMDEDIFQVPECYSRNQIEFVNAQVAMGFILSWTINTVSAVAFGTKWAGGRARPQEVVWEIHEHGAAHFEYGVPDDVVDNIKAMNLENEKAFTYKGKGAPGHPSHPAMHSAGSAISSWLQVAANPSDAQIAHAQHYDFTIAYFRSFAGVHYPSDNRAGLQLGRFILGLNGPQFVADEYGCSPDSTADILELATSKRPDVDWSVWNPPGWTDPVTTYNAKADWIGFTDLPPLCTGTPMSCFG